MQFESLLARPNSDPTGLAGFFNSGDIYITRVPARLDRYPELAQEARDKQAALDRITFAVQAEQEGYGTIAGTRRPAHPELIDVSLIVEKPPLDLARERLHVDGLGADQWLGWFGMHALAPSIYDLLGGLIAGDVRQGGEFQLTYAQELQRRREGYCALEIADGRRYDFGMPEDYVKSVTEYAREC